MRLYAAVQRVQFAKRFVNSDVVTWYYVYYRDDNRVFSKIHKTSQIGLAHVSLVSPIMIHLMKNSISRWQAFF